MWCLGSKAVSGSLPFCFEFKCVPGGGCKVLTVHSRLIIAPAKCLGPLGQTLPMQKPKTWHVYSDFFFLVFLLHFLPASSGIWPFVWSSSVVIGLILVASFLPDEVQVMELVESRSHLPGDSQDRVA